MQPNIKKTIIVFFYLIIILFSREDVSLNLKATPSKDELDTAPIKIIFNKMEAIKNNEKEYTLIFSGNVNFTQGSQSIYSDYLVLWGETKEKKKIEKNTSPKENTFDLTIKQIYGEGTVIYIQNEYKIICDKLFINLETQKGIMANATYRTKAKRRDLPLTIKAEHIIQISDNKFKAKDITFSTCPFAEPHYLFEASEAEIDNTKEGDSEIFMSNIFLKTEDVPLLYLPLLIVSSSDDIILRHTEYESSSRFGTKLGTLWGINLYNKTEDKREKKKVNKKDKWGTLFVQTDSYSKRGFAYGVDLDFKKKNHFEGKVDTYFIQDQGPDPSVSYNTRFLPMEKYRRGRFLFLNRYIISKQLRLDTEFSYLSDRYFLEEYFEQEYKEGKSQESYAYLRYINNDLGGYFITRPKANPFQSQTAYLPGLYLNTPQLKTKYGLYFSGTVYADRVKESYDNDLKQPDITYPRIQTKMKISRPFDLVNLKFYPYMGLNSTYIGETATGGSKNGTIGLSGIHASTELERVYDIDSEFLGIHKLRHKLGVDIRYNNAFGNTYNNTTLNVPDDIEAISNFSEIYVSVNNYFQTKDKEEKRVLDLLEIKTGIEYYPQSSRDTTGDVLQNVVSPMEWMINNPDKNGVYKPRKFSNLFASFYSGYNRYVRVTTKLFYNIEDHNKESFLTSFLIKPHKSSSIRISSSYAIGKTDSIKGDFTLQMSSKWGLFLGAQYDNLYNNYINKYIMVKRDFHEFYMLASFTKDYGKDENWFWITFQPKGFKAFNTKSAEDFRYR